MKEYKTNEELLEHLISKNVKIPNKESALKRIEKYSYYSIVNSYKSIFKNKNGNYKNNVSFDEIYALYNFDKNLKYIFLKYSLEIEVQIKAIMANQISKVYGIENYLNEKNLDERYDSKTKNKLIEKINKAINDDYKVHSAITHYKDKYGFIPPFVLTKILTLGVTSSYYGLLKQNDRQEIAKKFKISDKLLKQILKNLTIVRNICAHNDILYCFRNKTYLSFKVIDKEYINKDNKTNLYMVMRTMKLFLDDDYNNLVRELLDEVKKLEINLFSISIKDILKIMGFQEYFFLKKI